MSNTEKKKTDGNVLSDIFNCNYRKIKESIEYKDNWAKDSISLENAINENIPIGEMKKSITPDNRKVILIGTRHGTVLVYQRNPDGDRNVYWANTPKSVILETITPSNTLISLRSMIVLTGGYDSRNNVGVLLENMVKDINEKNIVSSHQIEMTS